MNPNQFDLVIKDENGTIAVIEVKNRKNLNTEDAKKIRRNLMAHSTLKSKYFVLISRENELELIVSQWINDLVRVEEGHRFTNEPERTLAEGQFINTIQGATVLSEVQA